MLTAEISGIMDAEGVTNATFSYQWVSNDGTDDADISGATESTYGRRLATWARPSR